MVLVWDGVDYDQLAAHFGSMLAKPTSDHERYLRDYVIPRVHGIDTRSRRLRGRSPKSPRSTPPQGERNDHA